MKAICQQASKSQTVIDMHVLKHPTVSLNHIFQLFDTLIKPILTYGCPVWGTGNYTDIETYHNKFLKRTLRVKSSTNTCLLYMESGRFPLSVFINMCIVKFWLKILKTCDEKLISAAYAQMMQDPDKYAWVKYTRDLLCSHGFGNVWRDQSVMNEKLFLANFEQRLKDTFIQNCISDVESSNKCRMYREIKTVYKCENYMDCNIKYDLRMYYTKFRLSSHKFLVVRARWRKEQISYHERTCLLCNIHDVQDEYHIALICKYFKDVREKYVKQYYYNRPSMMKFIELVNTHENY